MAQHADFSKAVGAIDRCHIRIKPPNTHKEVYFTYKQSHSIQMQAICDTGRFINVFIGYPGSVHDTRIFKNSPIYLNAEYPPKGYFLLSDRGYPCLETPTTVVTPHRMPQGRVQRRFNRHNSKARSIIERAFGIIKTRWRSTLFKALEVKISFCTDVVLACAFLHNICVTSGAILEPENDPTDADEPTLPEDSEGLQERSRAHMRDRLCAQVSAADTLAPQLLNHDYL